VAGCATPTGSAGHAGATANLELTFHLDHSAGADQCTPIKVTPDRIDTIVRLRCTYEGDETEVVERKLTVTDESGSNQSIPGAKRLYIHADDYFLATCLRDATPKEDVNNCTTVSVSGGLNGCKILRQHLLKENLIVSQCTRTEEEAKAELANVRWN